MDLQTVFETIGGFRNLLGFYKDATSLLPKHKQDEALQLVSTMEHNFQADNAKLARHLGYILCQCTFPPQIALYRHEQNVRICPECGARYSLKPRVVRSESKWLGAHRGTW